MGPLKSNESVLSSLFIKSKIKVRGLSAYNGQKIDYVRKVAKN